MEVFQHLGRSMCECFLIPRQKYVWKLEKNNVEKVSRHSLPASDRITIHTTVVLINPSARFGLLHFVGVVSISPL